MGVFINGELVPEVVDLVNMATQIHQLYLNKAAKPLVFQYEFFDKWGSPGSALIEAERSVYGVFHVWRCGGIHIYSSAAFDMVA